MLSSRTGRTYGRAVVALLAALAVALTSLALAPAAHAAAPVAGKTERVTFSTGGGPLVPVTADTENAVVSSDGRFVAFQSEATNLVPSGPNPNSSVDVYVADRLLGTIEQVSVRTNGAKGNLPSLRPSISDNGRYIAFVSDANNLVPNDTNSSTDAFIRDRVAGTTERVSLDGTGAQSAFTTDQVDISGDGNVVAFTNYGSLTPNDNDAHRDVYVRLRDAELTTLASLPSTLVVTDGDAYEPSLDRDGTVVAFSATATNLVASDTNGQEDVFVRDRTANTTERVSVSSSEAQGTGGVSQRADVSASGRHVVFQSQALNLGTGTGSSTWVLYLRDRQQGQTEIISRRANGTVATRAFNPSISADGSRVAFMSRDSSLLPNANCEPYGALRDRSDGVTLPAFPRADGGLCDGRDPVISASGRYLVSRSFREDIAPPDPADGDEQDVYIRILANNIFPDVPADHPFFEEISWLVDMGVTTGFNDGTYKGGNNVSRQAMAAFLYRYSGASAGPPPVPTFSDVGTVHPFYKEIEWMADTGFTSGFPDGTFKPDNPVTRQAMAAFVYRLAGQPAFTPPATPTFNDVGTGHAFRKEIEWMASVGLANGFPDGGFHSGDPISRQATAAFLFRFDLILET